MFAKIILLVSVVVGCAQGGLTIPFKLPTQITVNGTDLVDKVLEHIRADVIQFGLDEINTPNINLRVGSYGISIENGSFVGLANIERIGDVLVEAGLLSTKIRSTFAVSEISGDNDVDITTSCVNYTNGHVHLSMENVTISQVYKLTYATQTLSLDEFELGVGNVEVSITGLGDKLQNGTLLTTLVINKVKDPVLSILSVVLKNLINSALISLRGALIG